MIELVAVLFVATLGAILTWASARPDTFRVQRTTTINAAPERIVRLIENFYIWRAWSPYEKLDHELKRNYSGASKGTGAVYAWEGAKAGAGRMEILDSSQSEVKIKLDFVKPFEGHNVAEFRLEPHGDTTNLTWAMHGRQPLLVFNMDRLLGSDFEAGLRNLKAIAER